MIVLQAVNIAKGQLKCCREISLRAKIAQGNLIIPSRFDDPNPNCVVCAEKPTVTVQMNTSMVRYRRVILLNDTELFGLQQYQIRQTIAQSKRLDDYTSGKSKKGSQKIFHLHNLKKKLEN